MTTTELCDLYLRACAHSRRLDMFDPDGAVLIYVAGEGWRLANLHRRKPPRPETSVAGVPATVERNEDGQPVAVVSTSLQTWGLSWVGPPAATPEEAVRAEVRRRGDWEIRQLGRLGAEREAWDTRGVRPDWMAEKSTREDFERWYLQTRANVEGLVPVYADLGIEL